jgi:antitoxin HigA-1
MTSRPLSPIHPGEILAEEFLGPMGISQNELARALRVPPGRINQIVRGQRGISPDTALRLGRYFGIEPEFWINLQSRFDLETAKQTLAARVKREVPAGPPAAKVA